MYDQRRLGEELFSQRFQQLENIVRAVAARRRLNHDEGQELYSQVMLKVIQDDFAVLRRFRGTSRWSTYLTVIVQRVLLDHRVKEWGRWRPCARARRLGPTAVLLDRLIHRDGLEPAEAVCTLSTRGIGETAELERLADQIPRRPRRRLVSGDTHIDALVDEEQAGRRLESAECRRATVRLNETLTSVLQELPARDRDLLGLRFGHGWTVRRIAEKQHWEPRPLYRRFECILRRLRRRLERVGVGWKDVVAVLDGRDAGLEFDLR